MLRDERAGGKHNEISSLLLILERDLQSRFSVIERELRSEKHVLPLQNFTTRSWLRTLVRRFRMRHELEAAYRDLRGKIGHHHLLLLSNVEGFIAKNVIRWIRRDFPTVTLVQLQHGIFTLNAGKRASGMVINGITRYVAGIDLLGEGFVNRDVDYYLVYNSYYKSVLVAAGVRAEAVITASGLLKGHLDDHRSASRPAGNSAVLLLQPLSALGISDESSEAWLLEHVLNWMSRTYEHVIIKQHPYRDVRLPPLSANCSVGTSALSELACKCAVAVSFFSEALLECEYLGLKAIAVRSNRLKVNPEVYRLFQYIAEVTPEGGVCLKPAGRDFQYYESEVKNGDDLMLTIRRTGMGAGGQRALADHA